MSADNINPLTDLDLGVTVRGLVPGQKVLNRFTLQRVLGRGGMGVVWLAHDESLDFDVALKFLPEVLAKDKSAVEELKREARRSLELSHPHIVKFYYFFQDENCAGISMEYVAGDTLANLRLTRPAKVFEVEELQPWVSQLCQALSYAHHDVKIVHRDLKPANLMVDHQGRLKITDFGIARSVADSLTKATMHKGGVSGTLVYMSPQQAMGEQPSLADDIYAVGATLYELLTSKPPFYSGEILAQVREKTPPTITQRRKELGIEAKKIPMVWERTLAACLHKDPAQRPASALEIIERLNLETRPATAGIPAKPAAIQVVSPEEPTLQSEAPLKTPSQPQASPPAAPNKATTKPKRTPGRPARGAIIEVETEFTLPTTTPPPSAKPPPSTSKPVDLPPPTSPAPIAPTELTPPPPSEATGVPLRPPTTPKTATPTTPSPALTPAPTTPPPTATPPPPSQRTTIFPAAKPQPPTPVEPPSAPATVAEPPPAPPPTPPPPKKRAGPLISPKAKRTLAGALKWAAVIVVLAALSYAGVLGWKYYQQSKHPPGHLVVQVEPSDARLFLRGAQTLEPTAQGREFHQLTPGLYELVAERPGYWAATNPVTMQPQEGTSLARHQTMTLRLTPQTATLNLRAAPSDAQVTVTAQRTDSGQMPAPIKMSATDFSQKLLVGEYEVMLTRTGYRTWRTNVLLAAADTVTLSPALERSFGQLRVDSQPAGAQYTLTGPDGQRLTGQCPALLTNLPSGNWRVSLEANQYGGFVTNVMVLEDKLAAVVGTLSRLQGELLFSVSVPQARFELRGPVELGGTVAEEFRQKLPVGEYTLVLQAPGYYARTQQFAVASDQATTLGRMELRRITGWLRVTVEPPTATLILQPNRRLKSGEVIELPVGAYTLQAEQPGFETQMDSLTLLPRQTNQHVIRMNRSVGGLVFRVIPLQATNYLRYLTRELPGRDMSQIAVNQRTDLPTGEYELEVGMARYQTMKLRLSIAEGAVTNLGILRLEPLRGGLEIAFTPETARAELVAVDAPLGMNLTNLQAGTLTAPPPGLPVGEYELCITAPGFSNYVNRVNIRENQTLRPAKISLVRLTGGLIVNVPSPSIAVVHLSGPAEPLLPNEKFEQQRNAGRSIVFERLPTGRYTVHVTAPGHESLARQVDIAHGAPTTLDLPPLARSTGVLVVETTPPDGRLRIEQVESEAGLKNEFSPKVAAAPATFTGLPTGRYRITAVRPRTFTLPGLGTNDWLISGETQIAHAQSNHLSLAFPFASVTLQTQPPGARLWVGDQLVRDTQHPPLRLPEFGLDEKLALLARFPNYRPTNFIVDAKALGLRPQITQTITPSLQFWPGPQGDERYWTNSLGMVFVNLNRKVFVSIWECRVRDYTNIMSLTRVVNPAPYEQLERGARSSEARGFIDQAPIVNVNWMDAKSFCNKLQQREMGKFLSANHQYRLCTDAEWSLAFGLPEESGPTPSERSGALGPPWFQWGREFPPRVSCGNFPQAVSFDYFERLAPVGMFPPNQFGIFDMGGNVWEWCEDTLNKQSSERVLRGGSWKWDVVHSVYATAWLASFRRSAPPTTTADDIGFRVVLEITDAAETRPPRPQPERETPSKNVPPQVEAMRYALGWKKKGFEELGKESEFKPNLVEARRLWETAARAGDPESQFRFWYLVHYGLQTSRRGDETAAYHSLTQAVNQKLPAACIEYIELEIGKILATSISPDTANDLRSKLEEDCIALMRTEKGVLAARAAYLLFELGYRLDLRKGKSFMKGERLFPEPDVLQWLIIANHWGHWKTGNILRDYERNAAEDATCRIKWQTAQSNALEFLRGITVQKP